MLSMKPYVKILEETFPQLRDDGGYLLYRAKMGGQNHPLTRLQCNWYHIPDLKKEVPGSACIYIQPLQKEVNTAPRKKVC